MPHHEGQLSKVKSIIPHHLSSHPGSRFPRPGNLLPRLVRSNWQMPNGFIQWSEVLIKTAKHMQDEVEAGGMVESNHVHSALVEKASPKVKLIQTRSISATPDTLIPLYLNLYLDTWYLSTIDHLNLACPPNDIFLWELIFLRKKEIVTEISIIMSLIIYYVMTVIKIPFIQKLFFTASNTDTSSFL